MVFVRFHDRRTVVLFPTLFYLLNLNKPTQKKSEHTHTQKRTNNGNIRQEITGETKKTLTKKKKRKKRYQRFSVWVVFVSSSEVHRTRRAKKRDIENMEYVLNVICCPYSQPQV